MGKSHFLHKKFVGKEKNMYLCTAFEAQMAESVDALVSNTSGATRAGSTPALGTFNGFQESLNCLNTSV